MGAELYGHGGVESDIEILSLMLETLEVAGIQSPVLDLGHVDIVRGVIEAVSLTDNDKEKLADFYRSKALPELESFVNSLDLNQQQKAWLVALPRLCGGVEVLDKAQAILADAGEKVADALTSLAAIKTQIQARFPNVGLHFDLSDLVSYSYHTGLVFAAYVPGFGNAIARGGRYNNIGEVFGRSRPATGFSTDLKTLVSLADIKVEKAKRVLVPVAQDLSLWQAIQDLRAQNYQVVEQLTDLDSLVDYDYTLDQVQGEWQLVAATK
jgi:ATP phosphoribosyltransferase regulatory subunit